MIRASKNFVRSSGLTTGLRSLFSALKSYSRVEGTFMCGGGIHVWELLTCGGDIHVWELLTCGGGIHVLGVPHVWDEPPKWNSSLLDILLLISLRLLRRCVPFETLNNHCVFRLLRRCVQTQNNHCVSRKYQRRLNVKRSPCSPSFSSAPKYRWTTVLVNRDQTVSSAMKHIRKTNLTFTTTRTTSLQKQTSQIRTKKFKKVFHGRNEAPLTWKTAPSSVR